MSVKLRLAILLVLSMSGWQVHDVLCGDWQVGIGLNAGAGRLEGDLTNPRLGPMFSGHLRLLPTPYFAIEGELGYAQLNGSNSFRTTVIPIELGAMFNFMPFNKVNPFVFVGGGGVVWKNNTTSTNSKLDSFLKTGGGLEFRVSRNIGLEIGATYRLSLTDNLDAIYSGNEDDQVITGHAGLTYYFGGSPHDRDHDGIPDDLDLMPDISEDRDGYLDHDGIPEKNPSYLAMNSADGLVGDAMGPSAPIVIHHPISKVESGRDLTIKANVFSDKRLKVVAILYRPVSTRKWSVARLENRESNAYVGEIPGYAVLQDGLEYCVVAVDETLSGVGYSGLPSKPNIVSVSPSGTPWRIVGAGVGAAAVGAATYLVLKKQ